MIEKHFGFRLTPFTRELPVDKRLQLAFLDEQARALEDVVKRKMSALLVAPAGTGKTVVLRSMVQKLPQALYQCSYFKVNRLSGRDLCREISRAVGAITPISTYPGLVRALQDRFEHSVKSEGIRPVLIFDDAHALRPEGFELIKILTNFAMDSQLVVSIIFAGHPTLKDKLYQADLEDVRQRIIHCGELRLLSRDETIAYIEHRIRIAGCRTIPFDTECQEGIYEMSRGNMRAIDNLALQSLKKAAETNAKTVGIQHLHHARAQVWL